ncbi:flagellar basal body P-ring formation chaperone FlgA [Gynuella sp.]|uniref:flagellar basal body P-ring formation chaperone FlgA n=1 Tax=Gynuella sp. TaxID=2969146 RepID=UPI003D0CBDB6
MHRVQVFNRKAFSGVCFLTLSGLMLLASLASAANRQIEDSVLKYVVDAYSTRINKFQRDRLTISFETVLGDIDKDYCNSGLSIKPESDLPLGRENIAVSCIEPSGGWKIYVPITVSYFLPVATLKTAVSRNTRLTADMVEMADMDIGGLYRGYYTDLDNVVGQKAVRHLQPGTVLNNKLIEPPVLVERGDAVVIVARSSVIQVRMTGIALSAGSKGKQIRVRNERSHKVIKAEVIGEGLVRVVF